MAVSAERRAYLKSLPVEIQMLPRLLSKDLVTAPKAEQIEFLDRFYHVSDREFSPTSDTFSIGSTRMWEPMF